jgi:Icc-related predicted phosphoesterase
VAEVTLLALGDIHGRIGWTPALESAAASAAAIVVTGDLTQFGTPRDADRILDELSAFPGTLYAIAGNCDSPGIETRLQQRSVSLHGQGRMIGDRIGMCGVSGSNTTPFATPLEYTDAELEAALRRGWEMIRTAPLRIVVHHAPPWGTTVDLTGGGRHVGVRGLRTFCEQEGPELVLCGHIHEARGIDRIGETLVVNGGMAARGHGVLVQVGSEWTAELL